MTRLASVSVDLDEIHHYQRIHGIARAGSGSGAGPRSDDAGGHAVYDVAIPRFARFAREHALPLTFFAVGADARRPANAAALRRLSRAGHEIANHSLDHRYDLTRLPEAAMRRQVVEGALAIREAVGLVPTGFRAPGYLMNDRLAQVLAQCDVGYDSSVFPCPAYYAAKALVLGGQRVWGRRSASLVGSPEVLRAPIEPYRLGRPYWRRGTGLVELPIQVTRRLRLPFIGTALTLAGPRLAEWLVQQIIGAPFVNLELHGIDLLAAADGLSELAAYQADLRVPLARKFQVLQRVVAGLKGAGYQFVRLDEAAEQVAQSW